jgi:hypothetical protein
MATRMLLFIFILLNIGALGCQNGSKTDWRITQNFEYFDKIVKELARGGAEQLSSGQLTAILGAPDGKVPYDEFGAFLESTYPDDPDRRAEIKARIEHEWHGVLSLRQQQADSEDLASTTVWLYCWNEPARVKHAVKGIFLEHTHEGQISYCVFLDDGGVQTIVDLYR